MALLPWGIALGVLSIFYGPLVWQNHFWQRTFEFASLFLQGWGALPITEGLKDKQFFAFCMGFIIPVVYMGTLLYSLGMFLFRQSRLYLFMTLICLYGLGLYHYFIHRSGVTSYYAVVFPLIFVLLFWLKALLGCCKEHWQRGIKLFYAYGPSRPWSRVICLCIIPMRLICQLSIGPRKRSFMCRILILARMLSLIDALTAPEEPVPLISSFETKILMQADRRPFFYYFPMMESEQMQGDKLRGIYLHTYARLGATLKQLQDQKPAHIFIQTRLFEGPEAQNYEDSHEGFKQLMAYIRLHYQYQAQGQYLTALKLK